MTPCPSPLEFVVVRIFQARLLALVLGFFLAFGTAVPTVAQAQSCPASAFRGGVIPKDTRVRIIDLSTADAYYPNRGTLVGKVGRVDQLDPTGTGSDCWYGGQFYGDDGTSHYFYQVAVELLSSGSACPAGAYTGGSISSGTRVRVLTVSPEDAYYGTRAALEGKVGRVDGAWSKTGSPCWFAGQFYGDDGSSSYFYQAAVSVVGDVASANACPAGAATSGMAEGTRVRVLGLHPDDAYYPDAGTMVGTMGTVAGDLHSNDGCWMGGGMNGDDGTYYYFYKVAVQQIGGAPVAAAGCPASGYTGPAPVGGSRVKVLTVSPDDAYYGNKGSLEGVVGRTDASWSQTGSCWYAGQFYGDDGSSYYFYQASIQVLGPAEVTPQPVAAGCPPGSATSTLTEGTRVKVVAVHPEDAYHPDAATLIGIQGHVSGDLHPAEGCWLTGGFTADDGTYYYFYKTAVVNLGGGPTGNTQTNQRHMGQTIPAGQRFRLVALHPDDAYYVDRASIIGKQCTATETMQKQAAGWYSGSASCTDGSEYYFYKVGVVYE